MLMRRVVDNKVFVLGYRIVALVIISFGLVNTAGLFSVSTSWHIFFTYTAQSNVLVMLFFIVCIVKTAGVSADNKKAYRFGFYPVLSFTVSIAILITMLIFWTILAPMSWAGSYLMTYSNFAVHLICPLLMLFDRIMFYKPGTIRKFDPFFIIVFPYLHVAQSFIIGLNRLVYFAPMRIDSYYIYPFLDYDAHGNTVFLYILGLTVIFIGIGYGWRYIENRYAAKTASD
jgi:hypothetical protein